jgi:hypothetical protein
LFTDVTDPHRARPRSQSSQCLVGSEGLERAQKVRVTLERFRSYSPASGSAAAASACLTQSDAPRFPKFRSTDAQNSTSFAPFSWPLCPGTMVHPRYLQLWTRRKCGNAIYGTVRVAFVRNLLGGICNSAVAVAVEYQQAVLMRLSRRPWLCVTTCDQ